MSENAQPAVKLPPPSDIYQPPNTDTMVIVKFVGNTPQVLELRFIQATAEHLMVAGERLKIEYHKLQAIADQKAREQGILTTDKLPNSELAKG